MVEDISYVFIKARKDTFVPTSKSWHHYILSKGYEEWVIINVANSSIYREIFKAAILSPQYIVVFLT